MEKIDHVVPLFTFFSVHGFAHLLVMHESHRAC